MKKYRIPHKMFFTWFVPYPTRGSAAMGVLGPALVGVGLTVLGIDVFASTWSFPALAAFCGVWIHGYHRRFTMLPAFLISLSGFVLCRIVAIFVFSETTRLEQVLESLVVVMLGAYFGFVLQRHSSDSTPR